MSKNLEDLFNIDELKKAKDAVDKINQVMDTSVSDTEDESLPIELKQCLELEKHLADFNTIDAHDEDMDNIAKLALDGYTNLIDTAENFSDTRYAGKFYEAAIQLMKNAIDAKNSKVTAKLKKLELILKAEKLIQAKPGGSNEQETSEGMIIANRSDIIKAVRDTNKDK